MKQPQSHSFSSPIQYQSKTTQKPELFPWRINLWLLHWAILPSSLLKKCTNDLTKVGSSAPNQHHNFFCTTRSICFQHSHLYICSHRCFTNLFKSISNAIFHIQCPHHTPLTPRPNSSHALIQYLFESTLSHCLILHLFNSTKALSIDYLL